MLEVSVVGPAPDDIEIPLERNRMIEEYAKEQRGISVKQLCNAVRYQQVFSDESFAFPAITDDC